MVTTERCWDCGMNGLTLFNIFMCHSSKKKKSEYIYDSKINTSKRIIIPKYKKNASMKIKYASWSQSKEKRHPQTPARERLSSTLFSCMPQLQLWGEVHTGETVTFFFFFFFFFFGNRQPCSSDVQSGWCHETSCPAEVFCRAPQLGHQISTMRPC